MTRLAAVVLVLLGPIIAAAQPAHDETSDRPFLVVLGIAQDGGYPHAGCNKACCQRAASDSSLSRFVSSIAIVDPTTEQRWILDATPDFSDQLRLLDELAATERKSPGLDGVLLTHAHIGHYTGLMYLGREALGADRVPVYAMPRMRKFLADHGPWSQLLALENIALRELKADTDTILNERIRVTPLVVPHRDEFSETVAFVIRTDEKSALFLPDIDKWSKWGTRIEQVIADVDVALLDGTFYNNDEIPHRDMSEIPHPFIEESIERFSALPESERSKIQFIHLNHSNPALDAGSKAVDTIERHKMSVAEQGRCIAL